MESRFLPLAALTGVVLLTGFATGCRRELPPEIPQIISKSVEAEALPASIQAQKERVRAWEEMRHFYRKRQFQPAWSDVKGPGPHAAELIGTIDALAAADGLDPRRYQAERLTSLVEAAKADKSLKSPDAQRRLADLDVELTYTYLTLAAHAATGRLQPETMRIDWDSQPRNVDLDARLETVIAGKATVAESFKTLTPPNPAYVRLRDALARYRKLEAAGGWPAIPDGPSLKAGDQGGRVAALSARLAASGELAGPASPIFDESLSNAVARFQTSHGLDANGIVDKDTLAELNVPAAERVRQIEINLERWRWLPSSLGKSYIAVNVPEFRMELIENGKKTLDMAVVVGKQQSQTPVFSDRMTYLELNPEWNLPSSITGDEIVPKLAGDSNYLAKNDMEVVDSKGNVVAGAGLGEISDPASGYRVRQRPGRANPLGQVKFMFPNEYDVYLHDTPADHLFSREERDFSHGCIRLERPVQLAEVLLRGDPDWRGSKVRKAIQTGVQKTVTLPEPLPVHILYFTAWVEQDGTLQFRRDVYGHDARLASALEKEPIVMVDLPAIRGEVRAAGE